MSPSEDSESKNPSDAQGSVPPSAATPAIPSANLESQPPPNGSTKASDSAKEEKLTGAELKKRAKAEKQARREKQVQERQAAGTGRGAGAGHAPGVGQNTKSDAGKSHHESIPKGQIQGAKDEKRPRNQRRGSAAAESLKVLPMRGSAKRRDSTPSVPASNSKDVALFGHLYGQPRRTSVAGASRDIHPAILALGLQMSNYVICGSNARCVATLFCFKRVIESYTTPPGTTLTRHLTSHLSPQIDYLKSCRPLSVSMGNAIRWLKLEISNIGIDISEADAKTQLCSAIDTFIGERITVADQVIAEAAGSKIKDGDVIMTYAKSSIVQQTLVSAHKRGVKFRVIVMDSRPLFEGKHLACALALLGLEVQYSLLHGLDHVIKDASKVFLGAHAMTSNGRLVSRVGTAIVAMMADHADVPVIVCCESVKFTDRVALDSIVNNEIAPPDELIPPHHHDYHHHAATSSPPRPSTTVQDQPPLPPPLSSWHTTPNLQLLNIMYDLTPAEYIKMIITEYGSLPPSSVPVVHRLSTNL